MKVAIASGKGGTGKTTVATSLALVAGSGTRLLDCDVEEPNAHLFLKPVMTHQEPVNVRVPKVDAERCNACGECGAFCQYNAIVSFKTQPLLFPELCHACGGCALVCPTKAITEVPREIGVVERGQAGDIEFVHGVLKVGEAMSPPLIRAVKRYERSEGVQLIDAPPGTSCPVVAAVRGVDLVLLVTEPTPFGLHDLTLAVETMRQLELRMGVVLNRVGIGDRRVQEYCRSEGLALLTELPDDRRVAEAYSRGVPVVEAVPELRGRLEELLAAVRERADVAADRGADHAHV
jgi:MinD superfamily P-loop ATPase